MYMTDIEELTSLLDRLGVKYEKTYDGEDVTLHIRDCWWDSIELYFRLGDGSIKEREDYDSSEITGSR